MRHVKAIGRLGGLAIGLGIGAALAATPGIASADDMQISIDGFDLFPTAGNTASASSGMGDIAIAIGNGSNADAGHSFPGQFDFAFADGNNAFALDEFGNSDVASAIGDDSSAFAKNGNFDDAFATGTNNLAEAGGAGPGALLGNNDFASALGPNALALAGQTIGTNTGSNDIANVFDPFGTVGSSALAGDNGSFDLASVFGDSLSATTAQGGNFLLDILPML